MSQKKPSCDSFIIATIHAERLKANGPTNPNRIIGVPMKRVYAIVTTLYKEGQFRKALEALRRKGAVLLVMDKVTTVNEYVSHSRYLCFDSDEKMPIDAPLDGSWWFFNKEGEYIGSITTMSPPEFYERLSRFRLYVVADGLPSFAKKHTSSNKATTRAKQIMASLQK